MCRLFVVTFRKVLSEKDTLIQADTSEKQETGEERPLNAHESAVMPENNAPCWL